MPKPLINVSARCGFLKDGQPTPEFNKWCEKAKEFFDIQITELAFEDDDGNVVEAFLTIDTRTMQFRGDWEVSWLDPERLSNFRTWNETQ